MYTHAWRRNGLHLVAYKEDLALFDVMLSPLHDPTSNLIGEESEPHIVDIDSNEELVKKVVWED